VNQIYLNTARLLTQVAPVQWKLLNLQKLADKNANKFAAQAKALEDLLTVAH